MKAMDAEAELWNKACGVKPREDNVHGSGCGFPFGSDYEAMNGQRHGQEREVVWWASSMQDSLPNEH